MTPTRRLNVPKGTVLFRPGDPCEGFVRLRSGRIRVGLTAANGREVVLYRVNPGEVCLQTMTCLTEGGSYRAEGVAETDLVGEIVPRPAFVELIAEDSRFRAELLTAVSRRFSEFEQLVEDIALVGFRTRLARALLRLAAEDGTVAITHEALAAETASGRAAVSRALEAFEADGLVALGRGRISILDRAGLGAIAEPDR